MKKLRSEILNIRIYYEYQLQNCISILRDSGWIRLCSHCCRGYYFILIVHWT